jgi:hypothetical protein
MQCRNNKAAHCGIIRAAQRKWRLQMHSALRRRQLSGRGEQSNQRKMLVTVLPDTKDAVTEERL